MWEEAQVAMGKFCTKCGHELRPGLKFCPYCGAQIQTAAGGGDHLNGDGTDAAPFVENAAEEKADPTEESYARAVSLQEKGEYKQSLDLFSSLGGYKDSAARSVECERLLGEERRRKEEEAREKTYQSALALLDKGVYDASIVMFKGLGGYKDSPEKVREAEDKAKEADLRRRYVSCLLNDTEKRSERKLARSIQVLKSLNGYGDSERLIAEYEGCMPSAKKRAKKRRVLATISAGIACVLAVFAILTPTVFVPAGNRDRIAGWIDSGRYDYGSLIESIDETGMLDDRDGLKAMCRACRAFEAADYELGISCVYSIGGTVDVEYDAKGGSTEKSGETIKKSKHISNSASREGYKFYGWKLSDYSIKSLSHYASIKLDACYSTITYSLTYDLDGGTCESLRASYDTEQSVAFPNPAKTGYTFLGWTGDGLDEPQVDYVLPAGSIGNKKFTANWSANSYKIRLDPAGGTVSKDVIDVVYGVWYSLPSPNRLGYTFLGWYDGSAKVNSDGRWRYASSKTLVAHWSIIKYSINYVLNGGANDLSNPSSYTVESPTIALANPTKTGYTFLGWFDNSGNQVTSIAAGTTGDLALNAHWEANLNGLSVTSEDTSKGTAAIVSGNGYSGESITVVAAPIGDFVFKGWYNEDTKVSNDATYTFIMPTSDYSLVAHFFTKAEEEARAIKYATRPILSSDGKTITYGLYPQKNVNDSTLVSALNSLTTPESNDWYLYNDEYYAKVSATPCDSSYKFDNGATIVSGTTYWFKCEPIAWNVLSNTNGEYYILSNVLLNAHCYYNSKSNRTIGGKIVCPNNYEYSDIRAWLNNDFYNSAFALGNSHIQTTTVDNSAATTESSSNSYACNNTQDKVFLPSYKDYINSGYGFSSSTSSTNTRYCRTTDWARARGAYYNAKSSYLYNGLYWTRSPSSGGSYYAWGVGNGGYLNEYGAGYTIYSVRPGISIRIA